MAGILTGLVVHYAIMAVMAAVFMAFARSRPALLARPVLAGIAYGLITYVVMNLVVLPLRFGAPLPPPALSIALQLGAHVLLVGLPMAFIAGRYSGPGASIQS